MPGSAARYRSNSFSRGRLGFHIEYGKIVLATVPEGNSFFAFNSSSSARRMAGTSTELPLGKLLIVTCKGTISSTPGSIRVKNALAHARARLVSSIGGVLIVDIVRIL